MMNDSMYINSMHRVQAGPDPKGDADHLNKELKLEQIREELQTIQKGKMV
jgi:hypothetical protein